MTIEIETLEAAALDPRAQQHMAPMRDGVELATDVYLPDGQGPWPAVLVRLPYDKNGRYCWMPFIAGHFTERGYAFLPQDVRGKFRSGGEVNAFVHEVDDGYDTIQWITEQPWSNGDVGMWGDSYYGYTQWAAVASGHPALKAIVPRVTVADLFGWLDGDGVAPLYGAHYLAQYWADGRTHHWTPDWTRRPLSELFDPAFELIGSRSLAFDRLLAEARGQAPVDMYGDRHPFTRLRIPTLHGVGWFDNITPPHMLDYERLMSDPETAPFQYLHAGSTDHENYRFEFVPIPESEDHDTHDDALERMLPRYLAPALDFFDAFLAGRGDPESVPRVRWHLPNVGWHESPVWPPAGAREQRLYLTEAGGLSRGRARRGGGRVGARSREPGALHHREPVRLPLRVPRRGCGRLAARRRGVRVGRPGRPPDAGGPRRRPPDRGRRRPVHEPARQAGRRRPGGRVAHRALRPARGRQPRRRHRRRGLPGAHRVPRRGRPPVAAAGRLQRLPPVRGAPGDVREPVVCDPNGGQPPAPADRRRRHRRT